jgi:diaminopimelate decarboxylase
VPGGRIALRINPNVDAYTHKYITTGVEESKFGIMIRDLDSTLNSYDPAGPVVLTGIHFHIGSQIQDMSVFRSLCVRANEILAWFESRGYDLKEVNVGGGLGIDYNDPDSLPPFGDYFSLFAEHINLKPHQTLRFEIGRAAVGSAGSLIARVLYVKNGISSKFAVIDAGMNDLIRPALYQAFHRIDNLTSGRLPEKYTIVGPICESSDVFGAYRELPGTERGHLLAIRSAGAYGEAMASEYNMRKLPSAYFSDEI